VAQRVLVTDLDGTVLGDDGALERFAVWARRERDMWRLVYATGRSAASVRRAVGTTMLPSPDAIIADVGTSIVDLGGQLSDWPARSDAWDPDAVRRELRREPGLTFQEPAAQGDYKVSFHASRLHHVDLVRIARRLRSCGVRARLVRSEGRNLDIIPRNTGKGAAARHLLSRWAIDPGQVVCAGDSGNDRDLLRVGALGIVVANAHPELRSLRGRTIYHAVSSHADGVLEGIRRLEDAPVRSSAGSWARQEASQAVVAGQP
jgi:sucrose-phosphate synthase